MTPEFSEDPDEMLHDAAFHQGLHCLLVLNDLQNTMQYIFRNYIVLPVYLNTVNIQLTIPISLQQTKRRNPLVHKGLKNNSAP